MQLKLIPAIWLVYSYVYIYLSDDNVYAVDSDRRNSDYNKIQDRVGGGRLDWRKRDRGYNDWNRRRRDKNIPSTTKSGRIIKGRGVFVSFILN